MAAITKRHWLEQALSALVHYGPNHLSAEKLAKQLGVTRGSFYHHFGNMDHFVDAVVEHWLEKSAHIALRESRRFQGEPEKELEYLIEFAWKRENFEEDIAIRAWAITNSRVEAHVARIEKDMFDTIKRLYQAITGDAQRGERLAEIAHYGYLGALHSFPRKSRQEVRDLLWQIHGFLLEG